MRTYDAGAYSAADLTHASLSQGRAAVVVPAADGKAGVLAAFAKALAFPPHFGGNLDALSDCLLDWAEGLTGATALIWQRPAGLDAGTQDALTAILEDAEAGTPRLSILILR